MLKWLAIWRMVLELIEAIRQQIDPEYKKKVEEEKKTGLRTKSGKKIKKSPYRGRSNENSGR